MKLFTIAIVTAMLSTAILAQDIAPDKITESVPEIKRLTTEELKVQKRDFVNFLTKYRGSEMIGHTQYVLSALNLSIRANAKYSIETDGTILFQLATDGNKTIHYSDVTFPMQGAVYFELRNPDGLPIDFVDGDTGATLNFLGTKSTFYIVESEKSFQLRKQVQAKYNKEGQAIGRFLAITKYDLFTQDIEFYEIQNGSVLLRRGSFNGNIPPARRDW